MEMPNSAAASDGGSKRLFFMHEVYDQWQALASFLESRKGQSNEKDTATAWTLFYPDVPFVRFDDTTTDRETRAAAL
jgi:hypothetical protein